MNETVMWNLFDFLPNICFDEIPVWRSTTVCQWWVSPSSPHLHEVLTIWRVLIRPCSDEVLVDTSSASSQLFLFLSPLLPNSQMLLLHVFKIPLDYICLRGWVDQIIFVQASLLTFLGNFGTSHHFTVSEALARWACLQIKPTFQSAWAATLSHACSPYAPPTTIGLVTTWILLDNNDVGVDVSFTWSCCHPFLLKWWERDAWLKIRASLRSVAQPLLEKWADSHWTSSQHEASHGGLNFAGMMVHLKMMMSSEYLSMCFCQL